MAGCTGYGNVTIYSANIGQNQQAEIDYVRELTLPEEIRFNQMLEAHHTQIIRSGIAKKIEELEFVKHLAIRERYGSSAYNPYYIVDTQADLRVTKDTSELPEVIQVVLWGSRRNTRSGAIHAIGHCILVGDDKELHPKEPFTEEDIALVNELVEELEEAKNNGDLPHLDADFQGLSVVCPSYVTYAMERGLEGWLKDKNLLLG